MVLTKLCSLCKSNERLLQIKKILEKILSFFKSEKRNTLPLL